MTGSKRRHLLFIGITILIWLALPAGLVMAHANLVNSTPAPGQVLAKFPDHAELDFSESINPTNAEARLLNASGQVIGQGQVTVDSASPKVVRVALPPQPDGVYSLAWQVQSAEDGHITGGTIPFSVGLSSPKASLLPPPGTPDQAADFPAPVEVLLRWLGYLSISLVAGSLVFGLLVWRPAYRAAVITETNDPLILASEMDLPDLDSSLTRLLRRFILGGAIGVGASLIGLLIWQTIQLGSGTFQTPFGERLIEALGHHSGGMIWFQMILVPVTALYSTLLRGTGRGSRYYWLQLLLFSGLILFTFSMSGHNAALGSPLAVAADWLHITAMTVWIGGLLPLAYVLLRGRRVSGDSPARLLERVSRNFSRLAVTAVIVLAGTGLYSAYLQVETVPALLGTRYGQAVLVKTGIFALLVAFGAVNQQWIIPRMASAGMRAVQRLGQSVRVEYALGVLLLFAVGGLMSLAPAFEAMQAGYRMGVHQTFEGDGVRMDFRVAPAAVGDNEFGVDVIDRRPGADKVRPTVLMRVSDTMDMSGETQVEMTPAGNNRYTARGAYIAMMGGWRFNIIWRKAGFNDVTHVFVVDLSERAQAVGEKVNPVPSDTASINDGRRLYVKNCQSCHGTEGKGDGPSGRALNPPPADLTQHVLPGVHSDAQLFDWISDGFPGSAMPAFRDNLTENQRWNLVNFIRTFAK